MSLEGKRAVLVGGCGGIGLAIGQQLLKEGVQKLFILDVSDLSETNRLLLAGCNLRAEVLFQHCDISHQELLQQTLQRDVASALGTIDILVNSAGIAKSDVPGKVIDVNLTGVINACLIMLDLMSRAKGGSGGVIVNVASIAGLEPIPFLPIYCASKHGVVSFTRSLGVAPVYNDTGVKFISICPGATRTSLFDHCLDIPIQIDALKQMFQDYVTHFEAQSPTVVGVCVVRAIVEGENGSAWICNEGTIMPYTFPTSQFL